MEAAIEHLTQAVTVGFFALTTSPPAGALVEIRLQDLEELSDRFRAWCTNIISKPNGSTSSYRRLEDSPELLDAVQETLQNINEDLLEGW